MHKRPDNFPGSLVPVGRQAQDSPADRPVLSPCGRYQLFNGLGLLSNVKQDLNREESYGLPVSRP